MEAKKKATYTSSGLLKAFCKQKYFSSGMKTDFIPPHPDGLKKDLVLVGRRTIFLTTNQLPVWANVTVTVRLRTG